MVPQKISRNIDYIFTIPRTNPSLRLHLRQCFLSTSNYDVCLVPSLRQHISGSTLTCKTIFCAIFSSQQGESFYEII